MSNNPDVGKVFNLTGGNGGDGSLKLEGLSITKAPLKTAYKSGQSFDPTGMVVTALYAYGLTSDVTGYIVSPNVLTDGISEVVITYTQGRITKTASVNVTVEKVLTSINVTTPPTKTSYDYLEKFDPAGMVVTAYFSDGSSAPATGFTYSDAAFSSLGAVSVDVEYAYEGVTKQTTVPVTVNAISVAIPTQKNIPTYDGMQKTPEWDNYDSFKMTMTGDVNGVNAKVNYAAVFTLIYGYVFPDGTNEATVNWGINRATIAKVPEQVDVPAADGSLKSPSWDSYDPVKMTMSGDRSGTNAGDYPASFTPTSNYQWWDGTTETKPATWAINKATPIVTAPTAKTGLKFNGSNQALVNSGSTTGGTLQYSTDGNNYSADISTGYNAGTYKVYYKVAGDNNYNSAAANSINVTIAKADSSLTLNKSTVTLNTSKLSDTVTLTKVGDGTVSVKSSNTGVAKASLNGSTITIEHVNQTSGSAVITVEMAAGTNYNAATSKTINVIASFREYLYGYDLTVADSNPATRVSYPSDVENSAFTAAKMSISFSYGGWPSTPGSKFMPRPCMLKYDGTVDYYLNPNDYTKKADGTASDVANVNYGGNAMMEWPKIYVKRWESGGVYHFRCSDVKVDSDYECWCNYDKTNSEIPHFYTPIFFGSKDSSGRMRSISGQANWVSTGGAAAEVTAAQANGADIWTVEVLADQLLIQDLLVMMFKNTNLQTVAGMGVVSANAAIAPGTMNTKGLFWDDISGKTSGVKVFGMENWWGNIWRRISGWIAYAGSEKVKLTRGTKDGTTAADYNLTGDGYLTVESILWNGNCISAMTTKPYGRLPKTTAGSTTTYEADYANVAPSGVRVAIVGGDWDGGLHAGPFSVSLNYDATISDTRIGAALSCKPLAAA